MASRILVIKGSYRQQGNSNALADCLIAGALAAGKEVEVFDAARVNMSGCHGDGSCHTTGHCALKDDGVKLHELVCWADTLVLVSPVYFKSFTSQMKTVMDRFYPFVAPAGRQQCTLKDAFLIAVSANPDEAIFGCMKEEYKLFCDKVGLNQRGDLLVAGVAAPGDIKNRREMLQAAVAVGMAL